MDFSISLATSAHSWKVAKRAEELGFAAAWFFDTELLNAELFVAMGAAAVKTERIRLWTGMLIPSNRIAPVAASGLASLNALAPGRIDFGVGTGFTARRTLGLPAVKLADLEAYVRVVEALLRGETVDFQEPGHEPHKIRFLNPEIGLINLDDPIPLHVSAFGPRARKLTARLGAGWVGSMEGKSDGTGQIADMRKSWTEAGRDPATLHAATTTSGCVLAPGEPPDSPRAKAQAGPGASIIFHNFVEMEEMGTLGFPVPPELKPNLDAYRKIYRAYEPADARYLSNHRGHLMFMRPEEHGHITGEVIRNLTLTAEKDEIIDRVRAVKAAGYNQFNIQIRHGQEMAMLEDWADVFAKV
jgi:5,10-methylenetetrahydromethanopterin reductase